MSIINEEWRSIDGYINYQVSNIGRVRNANNGRMLKLSLKHLGYYDVGLSKEGKQHIFQVHRLVAKEFLENPDHLNYYTVDHIHRDNINNKVYNLRYATISQNGFNRIKDTIKNVT